MTTLAFDQAYIDGCAGELEDFLLSGVLYWPITAPSPEGTPPFPRLTLGGLLLAIKRIQARSNGPQYSELTDESTQKIEAVRKHWQSAWARKAELEISSRLMQWENFLGEYRKDPQMYARAYPREVYRRVILQLLRYETGQNESSAGTALEDLDRYLAKVFISGEFCWDSDLEPGFSKDEYWFLYGSLGD
jgi:hypothetical protein